MADQKQERIKELLERAADVTASALPAFLESECGTDSELRDELASLLQADAAAGSEFLGSPMPDLRPMVDAIADRDEAPDAVAAIPQRIGEFRIIRVLGQGGMGTVFEAEQDNPRRTVALKLINPGLASNPGILRRFRLEAQVLAQLHHPGVAHVYGAGEVDAGQGVQPFFAMELVSGQPLDEFAASRHLDTRQRLELVARVCDAVHHAHLKGVIHRDLKPRNILVDEAGQPKVVDFGVARATGADVQRTTVQTDLRQLVGTLPYMSPEQVSDDSSRLDARSDVYTLGVILYELLAGQLPIAVQNRPIPEAVRLIRESDPVRLSSVSTNFRGDIDTIVAKALEKDAARRYASAAALAADLRRFLRDEPIVARPASTFYQLRKFAVRHKGLVGGVTAAFVVLCVATVVVGMMALRERDQRRLADRSAQQARSEAYRARMAAAIGALERHDVAAARRNLNEAPAELRGWEWRHVRSRLDDSLLSIDLHGRDVAGVACSDDGAAVIGAARNDDRPPTLLRWDATTGGALPDGSEADAWRHLMLDPPPKRSMAGKTLLLPRADGSLASCDSGEWGIPPGRAMFTIAYSPRAGRLAFVVSDETSRDQLVLVDVGAEPPVARHVSVPPFTDLVVMSPDGRRLLEARETGEASIRDGATGELLLPLESGADRTVAAAFFADGSRLLTAHWSGTVRSWSAADGSLLASCHEHSDSVTTLALSRDEITLATGGRDATIRLWSADLLNALGLLHGHEISVVSLAFSPDGARLTSLGGDGTVKLWNARGGGDRDVLAGHSSYVYPVIFNHDGTMLVSSGWDRTIRLWDVPRQTCVRTLTGHTREIFQLALSPDESRLASTAADKTLRIWDVRTGAIVAELADHERFTEQPAFTPDGRRIVTGWPRGGRVTVWDPQTSESTEEPLTVLEGARAPWISPDGSHVLMQNETEAFVLDAHDGRRRFSLGPSAAVRTRSAAFSSDSRLLVAPAADYTSVVWDLAAEKQVAVLRGHLDKVLAAAFSPDGARIATAGRDQAIRIWETRTFQEVAELRGHSSYVWSLAFSPGGSTLVSGSGDRTLRLWRTAP